MYSYYSIFTFQHFAAVASLGVGAEGADQGRNHGWKVEGGQGLGPNAPAPGQRPGWVLGAGAGRPIPLWGSGGITPGKFVKTQMLNHSGDYYAY